MNIASAQLCCKKSRQCKQAFASSSADVGICLVMQPFREMQPLSACARSQNHPTNKGIGGQVAHHVPERCQILWTQAQNHTESMHKATWKAQSRAGSAHLQVLDALLSLRPQEGCFHDSFQLGLAVQLLPLHQLLSLLCQLISHALHCPA